MLNGDFLKGWNIWLPIILLLIPGLIYQFDFNLISQSFEGFPLLVLTLIKSLYYSFPFWMLGILIFMIWAIWNKRDFKKDMGDWEEILMISLFSMASYWLISLAKNFVDKFIVCYLIVLFVIIILLFLFNIFKLKKVWSNKGNVVLGRFLEVYFIGIGIGLIVTGLSLLSPKPIDLLISGFIILAIGSIIFALNDKVNSKKK